MDKWKWTRRTFKSVGGLFMLSCGLGVWEFTDLVRDKTTLQDSYHFVKKHPVCYLIPIGTVTSTPITSFAFWAGKRYNNDNRKD